MLARGTRPRARRLGSAARRRPVGDETSEAAAVPRYEPVRAVEHAGGNEPDEPTERSRRPHLPEQNRNPRAVADEGAVLPDQPPAREPLAPRKLAEELSGVGVLQRQDRECFFAVGSSNQACREATSAALGVVEEHWPQLPGLEALEHRADEGAERVEHVAALLHEDGRDAERAEPPAGLAEAVLGHLER